jgi:high affinity sulfate transporter 1
MTDLRSADSPPVRGRLVDRGQQDGWRKWVPGWQAVREYDGAWLRSDVVAGLVMTSMLVPVGIAYAQAAGLPGINGLYATIVPLVAYAVFGPSRILVVSPDSALSALILAVVLPLGSANAQHAVAVGAAMAIVSGVICVAAGLAGLGFITDLLSKPIRYGYMNGIAVTVIVSQIPKLLGFSGSQHDVLHQIVEIAAKLSTREVNVTALAIGSMALALILMLKRAPRVPGMLIAVGLSTVAVAIFDLAQRAGVAVLGPLPAGLPGIRVPLVGWNELSTIVSGGVAVALVSFADTSVLSRVYAAKLRTRVDTSQEMVAIGVANLAAGVFQGFPISSSSSRTAVAEAAGAKTQLAGLVGAATIGLLLLFAPALLRDLPQAALAAVVIASAIGFMEIADLRRIYRIQQWEFWLSIVCFVGVAVLGTIPGIALAITLAVIEFLWDGWRPHSAVLGRVDKVKGYHDITRYPHARQIPGLVLFRWDAPLFFANAEFFHQRVANAIDSAPTPVRWLVVAAEPVTSVDVTAADVIVDLDDALREAGIELRFAEMKDPVKDKLKRFGLYERFGESMFYQTVGEAVAAYRESTDIDWVDWEDRHRG